MRSSKLILLVLIVLLFGITSFYFYKRNEASEGGQQKVAEQIQSLTKDNKFQNGDLIFHTSRSAQSQAIQLATNSKYSHCGIIYQENGEYFVFEAVQPVSSTPLHKWIARGEDGHFVVKRLKNAGQVLTPSVLAKLKQAGNQYVGKDYDLYFEWSDNKIYCSELIWKVYQQATGLEIGQLEQLKDFNLSAKPVQAKMRERYGNRIPYEEKVISPASMFASDLLKTVLEQ